MENLFRAKIENFGDIIGYNGRYDQVLETIANDGCTPISLSQLAFARINDNLDGLISLNPSVVKEGVLYLPNHEHKRILLRDSSKLINPYGLFFENNRRSKLYLDDDFNADEFFKGLSADQYYIVKDEHKFYYKKEDMTDPIFKWSFGKNAKNYWDIFSDSYGVPRIDFHLFSDEDLLSHKRPFIVPLILRGLSEEETHMYPDEGRPYISHYISGVFNFHSDKNIFGFKEFVKSYSSEEILKATKSISLPIQGNLGEKILTELAKLPHSSMNKKIVYDKHVEDMPEKSVYDERVEDALKQLEYGTTIQNGEESGIIYFKKTKKNILNNLDIYSEKEDRDKMKLEYSKLKMDCYYEQNIEYNFTGFEKKSFKYIKEHVESYTGNDEDDRYYFF